MLPSGPLVRNLIEASSRYSWPSIAKRGLRIHTDLGGVVQKDRPELFYATGIVPWVGALLTNRQQRYCMETTVIKKSKQ